MTWSNIINKIDTEKRDWAKASASHIDFEDPKAWDRALLELEKEGL